MQETQVWSLGQEYHLENEMATHSSILAWEIPQTEEPGGLQPDTTVAKQKNNNIFIPPLTTSFMCNTDAYMFNS